jgi:DNA-binding NarL/FixJ family response regulator
MSIKILIVDDHTVLREGLRTLLNKEPDLEVIGEAGNGVEAVQKASELTPDIIIMDLNLPDMNGAAATRKILENRPESKVIALSMESDKRYIIDILGAGAMGYVLKDCFFAELAGAIRTVAKGDNYLGPRITEMIIKDYLQRVPDSLPLSSSSLTQREREIVQLIAEGKNTKEIAANFGTSVKTIEVHRHNIMKKLDLYSIAELTKYAVREGLTSLK